MAEKVTSACVDSHASHQMTCWRALSNETSYLLVWVFVRK